MDLRGRNDVSYKLCYEGGGTSACTNVPSTTGTITGVLNIKAVDKGGGGGGANFRDYYSKQGQIQEIKKKKKKKKKEGGPLPPGSVHHCCMVK